MHLDLVLNTLKLHLDVFYLYLFKGLQSWTKYVETDCEFIQKSAKVHFTKIVTKPHIYVKGTKNITFAPLNDM